MSTDKRVELADFKKFKPYLKTLMAFIVYLRFGTSVQPYLEIGFFISNLEKDITENGN